MKPTQSEVDKAISWFSETRHRKPLAALIHPERGGVEMHYRHVMFYVDDSVPLSDENGPILFLLGDCVEPAVRIYRRKK